MIVRFWTWFKSDGDKLFTFVALASAALQGQTDLPSWVMRGALIGGILATAAHQSFFPQPAEPAQLKEIGK